MDEYEEKLKKAKRIVPYIIFIPFALTFVIAIAAYMLTDSTSKKDNTVVTSEDLGLLPYEQYQISVDSPKAQAFIQQYKTLLPELVGSETRPDRYILKNGTYLCGQISLQEIRNNHIMSFQEMTEYVAPRVIGNTIEEPATPEEAGTIVKIAVNTICPTYSERLK